MIRIKRFQKNQKNQWLDTCVMQATISSLKSHMSGYFLVISWLYSNRIIPTSQS